VVGKWRCTSGEEGGLAMHLDEVQLSSELLDEQWNGSLRSLGTDEGGDGGDDGGLDGDHVCGC